MEAPSWATAPDGEVTVLVTGTSCGGTTVPSRVTLSDRKSVWFFGRNSDVCDVAVPYATVSRVHASLAHCNGKFFLIDMGSVHGTFVNGQRLDPKSTVPVVCGKDTISFSNYQFTYTIQTSATGAVGCLAAAYDSSSDSEGAAVEAGFQTGPVPTSRWPSEAAGGRGVTATGQQQAEDTLHREDQHSSKGRGSREARRRDRGTAGGRSRSRSRDRRRHRARSWSRERRRRRSRSRSRSRSRDRGRDRRRSRERGGERHGRDEGRWSRDAPSSKQDKVPAAEARGGHAGPKQPRKSRFDSGPTVAAPLAAAAAAASAAVAVAPQSAADIVKQMMAAPAGGMMALTGTSGLTVEQKKKLLWGGKKAAEPQSTVAPAAPPGGVSYNHWEKVHFGNDQDQEKFQKLMGVKAKPSEGPVPLAPGRMEEEGVVLDGSKQSAVLHDLEKQYVSGLRRKDGRTVGLGL